jgi:hypothetical protein
MIVLWEIGMNMIWGMFLTLFVIFLFVGMITVAVVITYALVVMILKEIKRFRNKEKEK